MTERNDYETRLADLESQRISTEAELAELATAIRESGAADPEKLQEFSRRREKLRIELEALAGDQERARSGLAAVGRAEEAEQLKALRERRDELAARRCEAAHGVDVAARKLAESLDLYFGCAGSHYETLIALEGGVRVHVEHASPLGAGALGGALRAAGVHQLGPVAKAIPFATADQDRR